MTDTVKPGEVLQDDENFRVEVIDWDGRSAIKKTAQPTMPKKRLERVHIDIVGMDFFRDIADKHPDFDLYIPKVYEHGDNYYIREYIDCPVVADRTMAYSEAAPPVEKLAEVLAKIDTLEPVGPAGYIGSSNYKNLHGSIARWVHDNLTEDLIKQPQADRILEISAGLGQYLRPRIAHGDLSAYKHTFIKENKIVLIDFEVFTTQAARYFDVAWCYSRMYGLGSPQLAKHFLSTFISKAEETEHQIEQLMAVLIQRIVGLQHDAAGDAQRGNDYRSRAQELLELVMENKLGILHS